LLLLIVAFSCLRRNEAESDKDRAATTNGYRNINRLIYGQNLWSTSLEIATV
jgi:hypothetical protein